MTTTRATELANCQLLPWYVQNKLQQIAISSYSIVALLPASDSEASELGFWPAEVATSMVTACTPQLVPEPLFAAEGQGCSANLTLSLTLLAWRTWLHYLSHKELVVCPAWMERWGSFTTCAGHANWPAWSALLRGDLVVFWAERKKYKEKPVFRLRWRGVRRLTKSSRR
jgi:hypothetical protein